MIKEMVEKNWVKIDDILKEKICHIIIKQATITSRLFLLEKYILCLNHIY